VGDYSRPGGYAKGEKTRERVLSQAARLFAKHGYDGLSMDKLAKALKLTKGALYAHYSGKYEIYLESTIGYLNDYNRGRPQTDVSKDAEQNLERYLRWLLEAFEKDKTYRLLMLRLFIEADTKTTQVVAEGALAPPVAHLTELIKAYKPHINATDFVYSLAMVAMLNPDMRKTLSVFSPGAKSQRSVDAVVEHLMQILRVA